MKKVLKNNKGITLIALVVTIVVLLILAGVSINLVLGNNGIISKAKDAKDKTEQSRLEGIVELAIGSLIIENEGTTSGITPEMLAKEVNKMENRTDVVAEGSTFPTNLIFQEENRKVAVELERPETELGFDAIIDDVIKNPDKYLGKAEEKGQDTQNNKNIGIGTDKEVVNLDLWLYEKTYDGKSMALGQFVMSGVYNPGYIGKIINGEIIGKIPQYIYISEEKAIYEVTELRGTFKSLEVVNLPKIPETVIKLESAFLRCNKLKNVELPKNIQIIGYQSFYGCTSIENLYIPNKNVECRQAFEGWTANQTINFECQESTKNEWYNWNSGCNAKINWNVSR